MPNYQSCSVPFSPLDLSRGPGLTATQKRKLADEDCGQAVPPPCAENQSQVRSALGSLEQHLADLTNELVGLTEALEPVMLQGPPLCTQEKEKEKVDRSGYVPLAVRIWMSVEIVQGINDLIIRLRENVSI